MQLFVTLLRNQYAYYVGPISNIRFEQRSKKILRAKILLFLRIMIFTGLSKFKFDMTGSRWLTSLFPISSSGREVRKYWDLKYCFFSARITIFFFFFFYYRKYLLVWASLSRNWHDGHRVRLTTIKVDIGHLGRCATCHTYVILIVVTTATHQPIEAPHETTAVTSWVAS